MNILIIKWGALGDILAAVPTIIEMRNLYPSSRITLLSSAISKDILSNSTIVNKILDIKKLKSEMSIIKIIANLKKEKFDLVLNLKWGSESADIIALNLGRQCSTIGGSKKRFFRMFYNYKPKNEILNDSNRHEYLKNMDILLSYKQIVPKMNSYIDISDADRNSVHAFLKKFKIQKNFIVVSPGASTLKKAWKAENYIALCKKIIAEYKVDIVVTYSKEDYEYSKNIVEQIGKNCTLSMPTTINEVAEILNQAQLCICNNSGIMHIAYAVQTPVMCFNTSIGWRPFSTADISIDNIPQGVKNNRSLSNDDVERLLEEISVDDAYEYFQNSKISATLK